MQHWILGGCGRRSERSERSVYGSASDSELVWKDSASIEKAVSTVHH